MCVVINGNRGEEACMHHSLPQGRAQEWRGEEKPAASGFDISHAIQPITHDRAAGPFCAEREVTPKPAKLSPGVIQCWAS